MPSDQTILEDIQFSLDLLKNGRIDEAREYLDSINHPKAKQFLAQLEDTITKPQSRPTSKQRSTMSDDRRQELVRHREEKRQQLSHRSTPVVDETRVSIFEAWKRNMEAATHKEAWWFGIAAVVIPSLVLLVISSFTFMLTVVAYFGLAAYLFWGEEITRVDKDSGAVTRYYQINNWPHYQVNALAPKKIAYTGEDISLSFPASFSSYYALTFREERDVAAAIIRSALVSLWMNGFIEVYEMKISRKIFDNPIDSNKLIFAFALAKDVTNAQVDGVVETHLIKNIRSYHAKNVARLFTRPWQPGPTPYEVTYDYMEKTHYKASQRIINIVRSDPVAKRVGKTSGNAPSTTRDNETVRNEGLQILRLGAGQTPDTRAFMTALNNEVAAAVRQRTATKSS